MAGNDGGPSKCDEGSQTISALTLEALKNADENGYGAELRLLANTEIAVDLMNYASDLEDVQGLDLLEMLRVIDEWKKNDNQGTS